MHDNAVAKGRSGLCLQSSAAPTALTFPVTQVIRGQNGTCRDWMCGFWQGLPLRKIQPGVLTHGPGLIHIFHMPQACMLHMGRRTSPAGARNSPFAVTDCSSVLMCQVAGKFTASLGSIRLQSYCPSSVILSLSELHPLPEFHPMCPWIKQKHFKSCVQMHSHTVGL